MAAIDHSPPRGVVSVRAREQIILRVPMRIAPEMPGRGPPRIEWREKKGPRCVPLDSIAGAAVNDPGSVDVILRGGKRIRAELQDECPALDFYSGFYVRSSAGDRMICSGRDAVHSRSGGECEIERFRTLEPKVKR